MNGIFFCLRFDKDGSISWNGKWRLSSFSTSSHFFLTLAGSLVEAAMFGQEMMIQFWVLGVNGVICQQFKEYRSFVSCSALFYVLYLSESFVVCLFFLSCGAAWPVGYLR